MQMVKSDPDETILELLFSFIVSAKKRIYIETPYFVPDPAIHNSEFFIFFIYIKVSNRSYSLFISDINVGNYNVTEHPGLCLKYIKMPVFNYIAEPN